MDRPPHSPSQPPSERADPASSEDDLEVDLPAEPPPAGEQPPIFTPADHLKLLQLQARRAIAERVARGQPSQQSDDAEASDTESPAPPIADVWRLVPSGTTLHAWQAECLPRWLERAHGTIKVATGGGKTLFALAAIQELHNTREPDLRVAIVVPTIPLMLQWVDELRKGNLPDSAIGMLGGGHDPEPLHLRRVLVCVLNSARDRLPRLVEQAGWSRRLLLVVDECHRAKAEQARRIFDSKPAFTLGLSATPESMDDDLTVPSDQAYAQGPVGQGLGPIIFELTLRQCLDAGLLAPFELWHVGLPLGPEESRQHAALSREISDLRVDLEKAHRASRSRQSLVAWCQGQAPREESAARFIQLTGRRKRLLYRASSRLHATLAILCSEVDGQGSRAITFHEAIEEVERIFLEALQTGIPAVLEHSQLPAGLRRENIEAFRAGTARVVVSAKSLVEGFNVPAADTGIIVASTSSVRQRIQSLGRLLRRKQDGHTARIYVLYISGTGDEFIYERTPWESIIGATVNRYFLWMPPASADWSEGLRETGTPPRRYLPPSSQVDVSALAAGDAYPGRPEGADLKVDPDGNLRVLATNQLVAAPRDLVDHVLGNAYRRARCTPAGHLIVRIDDDTRKGSTWRYVGRLELPQAEEQPVSRVELLLRSRARRRMIARARPDGEDFAKGPQEMVTALLEWTQRLADEHGASIKKLYWDGDSEYWVEISGKRVPFDGPAVPLEL
jgi:superfamily II DNA or RNA helicase